MATVFDDKPTRAIGTLDRALLMYQKATEDEITTGPDPVDRIVRHVDQRSRQDISND